MARYEILDSPKEEDFDDIVKLAAQICDAPISLISLIDRNRQWFKATEGFDANELPLDQSICRKLMHLDDVSVVQDARLDARFDDNPLVHGEGGLRFYAGAPLQTPDGITIGMLCVLDREPRDLTPQQTSALKVLARQVMVQFELRSALRQQTSISAELDMARTNAVTTSIEKTDFLAHISHEIRTPMNAIIGFSTILAMTEPLTLKQKEFIKTLQISADALLELVNDLLDIAKIEARSIELESTPFSLEQTVQDIIAMMAARIREKGITFTADIRDIAGRRFIGDPMRVHQIVLNLCSNAIKFTAHGGIHIRIQCEAGEGSDTARIRLSVTDTGIGIPTDKLESVFEKFTQVDTTVNLQYGGTGLGLAITKTLVETMGGTISVDSVEGRGSIFTISLSLPIAESVGAEAVSLEDLEAIVPDNAHRDTILLVEDYAPNVMVAREFLTRFGYDVKVATNGIEAVEFVKTGEFALILMDVQMHSLDGLSAASFICHWEKQNAHPHIPIIGMTAHALSGDRERCLAAGMDDYVSKPFKPAELQGKIETLIRKTSALAAKRAVR